MKQVWIRCPCCNEEHRVFPLRTVRGPSTRKRKISATVKDKDDQWAAAIKNRDGYACRYCGDSASVQAAHIFSRSKRATRWELNNGVALCGYHHLWWAHKSPLEFYQWVVSWMGQEAFDDLRARSEQTSRVKRPSSA